MLPQLVLDQIESWAADFAGTFAYERLESPVKEHAPGVVHAFLRAACDRGDCGPADLTEAAVTGALLESMPLLDLPADVRPRIPEVARAFLESLEEGGRLARGAALGRLVAAAAPAFAERLHPKGGLRAPPLKAASGVGRNDPCPCGSGKKYKKCCGRGFS